ncbi:uroporphyrinogen decarboxylase [Antarcticibacterium arcticum]|uniref:Uroporphyrinogen decarboxylase n=1 Tax=Antarcticibacterium arcticum TaxID=2585771 RepID=A0A5B8YKH7_9FLAO|nr:uroporphyrinogen decarboxylase [Antarcticibacterium arcticum]QED37688.1 uroporphyrinogen decarboxylase [Antarcticibacterium arcticum]
MEILGISYIEWIGYAASLFVLLSFLMRNITTLRYVNSIGCLFFVAYGILLDSWPIIITNVAIVCVNVYYLFINKKTPVPADAVKP